MGLCASKPQAAADAAPAAALSAGAAPTAAAANASAAEEAAAAAAEAHDMVPQLTAAPSAVPGAVDAASGPSASLLRKEQSVVGALPVFTKTPSNGSRRGVPISDLPPPLPSPSPSPAPVTPAPAAAVSADGSLGRVSKGYDPLERPSRSALRNASEDGAAVTPAAAPPGDGSSNNNTTTGPTPPSRKSQDSVKFGGAVAAGAATVGAAAAAAAIVDAEAVVDPDTAERRRALGLVSKTFSMRAVVDRFYERVTADPLLRPFFERVDEHKLKRHQEAAFALAFGGQELLVTLEAPPGAKGGAAPPPPSDLRAIHRRQMLEYGLGLEHFDAFIAHFKETVDAIPAIPDEQRRMALAQLRATRPLFEPLSPGECEQLEREQQQQGDEGQGREQRPSSGGGRRKFLLFGPRVGGGSSAGGAGALPS